MKDFFNEIKNSPNFLFSVVAVVGLIFSLFFISNSDIASKKLKPDLSEQKSLMPNEGIPPSMFVTFKEELKQKPIIKKKTPDKKKSSYQFEDLIKVSRKETPSLTDRDKLRLEILVARKKRGSVRIASKDVKTGAFSYKNIYVDQSEDEDFSAHDLAKSVPTYPVDLSRTLTMDRFMSAVLYTEIKSELPSKKVLAMIDQDVYAAHGRKILVPRGSKAIGKYEPLDEQGQSRLMISWYRIITPDGINIKLDSETADEEGAAGMTGEVDDRLLDKYGTALLFSSLSAVSQLSVQTDNESQSAAAESFSKEFGSVTAQALENSFDIAPRVRIPRGARINISPLTDIWFKPPIQGQAQVVPMDEMRYDGKYAHTKFQRARAGEFQFEGVSTDLIKERPLFLTEDIIKELEKRQIEQAKLEPTDKTLQEADHIFSGEQKKTHFAPIPLVNSAKAYLKNSNN
jgi:type IV secretory pathway VirB10-like protein